MKTFPVVFGGRRKVSFGAEVGKLASKTKPLNTFTYKHFSVSRKMQRVRYAIDVVVFRRCENNVFSCLPRCHTLSFLVHFSTILPLTYIYFVICSFIVISSANIHTYITHTYTLYLPKSKHVFYAVWCRNGNIWWQSIWNYQCYSRRKIRTHNFSCCFYYSLFASCSQPHTK